MGRLNNESLRAMLATVYPNMMINADFTAQELTSARPHFQMIDFGDPSLFATL